MYRNSTISVIIPTYNSACFIHQAVKSVLGQTVQPNEIIVVDDGSDDETEQVLQPFKSQITYIFQKNSGPAVARNRGLKVATGEFISFLDADDLWHRKKLEILLEDFQKEETLGVSLGFTFKCKFSSFEDIDVDEAYLRSEFALLLGSGLMKKSVFEEIGIFDEDMTIGEDTDWFMRVRENGIPISVKQKTVLYYRYHNKNLTKNDSIYNRSIFQILKKAKDRKANSTLPHHPGMKKPENQKDLIEMWDSAKI